MKNLKHILLLFCVLTASCNRNPELNYALERAGENRAELEKVLEHYRDSGMKYEAARFLIENMPASFGADSADLQRLRPVYEKHHAISSEHGFAYSTAWGERLDSLCEAEAHKFHRTTMSVDVENLPADYLIEEIDRSFRAWKENVHARDCSFEDFCEYILPYRRLNGLLADSMRDTFHHRHVDRYFKDSNRFWRDEADSLLYEYRQIRHSGFWGASLPVFSADVVEYLRVALCMHKCWFNSLLLSAMGMPVAIDFVPGWGNRNSSHTWNVVMIDGESHAFEPFWDHDRWKYKRIYNNRDIDHLRGKFRLPKVFRYTYSNHVEGPVGDSRVERGDIPPVFRNVKKKDVSAEYFEPHDLTVKLTEEAPEDARYAYLAVFGHGRWHPVQWGELKADGTVLFKGMGHDIVYLPVYYDDGAVIPAASPFKLESDGTMRTLADNGQRGTVRTRVIRGAWVSDYHRLHFGRMRGVRLTGLENGKPQEELHVWKDSLQLGYTKENFQSGKAFRHVRMYLPVDTLALGEIGFYTAEGKVKDVKITSDIRVTHPEERVEMLTDGLESTTCQGTVPGRMVDFDLGKSCKLTAWEVHPYLDSEIREDDHYELMYWQDGWKTAGEQTGTTCGYVTFENVPTGALMMLRSRQRKWEADSSERPFIYKDGRISWE